MVTRRVWITDEAQLDDEALGRLGQTYAEA
jgi:hypothetical protein